MANIFSYDPKETGKRIAAERKRLGFKSQQAFLDAFSDGGAKLPATRIAFSKWENGDITSDFSVWHLLELCKIFGCDPGYLLGEYPCHTREATDIQQATGLSEGAVGKLLALEDDPACALENLIMSPRFIDLLQALYHCLTVDFFPTDIERLLSIEDANADIPRAACYAHPDQTEEVNTARQFRRDICVFNTQRLLTEIATDFVNSSLDAFEEDQAAIAQTIASIKAKKWR